MLELSLVITTRNRAAQLRRCLEEVAAAKWSARAELVVVDNGSTDGTALVLEEFRRSAPLPMVILREPVLGSGQSRNRGWQAAGAPVIAFVDDDCYIARDWPAQVLAAFADDPELGYFGGQVRLYDPDDYPLTINESPVPQSFPPKSFLPPGVIQGANMAFRRAVLERIHGFDPDFGAGAPFSGDDVDACARASFAGWRGAYVPTAVVYHHHRRKFAQAAALQRRYSIGRGAYMVKSILRRDSRPLYSRQWWYQLREGARGARDRRECLQELWGGVRYMFRRGGMACLSPAFALLLLFSKTHPPEQLLDQ